jgi:hypothetical protein
VKRWTETGAWSRGAMRATKKASANRVAVTRRDRAGRNLALVAFP